MNDQIEKTQEQIDFDDAVKIAERAKTYIRMIMLLRNAGSKWYQTHHDEIITFVQVLQERQEGEEIEAPKNVQDLFNALSFSKKRQAALNKYEKYWEAWEGSKSASVMLARIKTLDPHCTLTLESDIDMIRIHLCDTLSGYSKEMTRLYTSKFYQA